MDEFNSHRAMPGTPLNQGSMLSTLMTAATRANSAAFICFLCDDNNELEIDNNNDDDDNDKDDDFMLKNWFGLAPPPALHCTVHPIVEVYSIHYY